MGRIEARRREPYVVLGLIITLFFIWKSGYVPVVSSLDFASATCPENVPGPSNERKDVQIVLEQHYYAPNHRITWGNDLPESKLVAHATGELDFCRLPPPFLPPPMALGHWRQTSHDDISMSVKEGCI